MNLYPTLQQDLNRVKHISQNQNKLEINRQIIHPRRNRNFQTPRVHSNIPQSATPTTSELSSSTLPETPSLSSQHSISNIPSDYLGSTPTSEQTRENLFNPTDTIERPQYWTTHSYIYAQGEPKLFNEPIVIQLIIPARNTFPSINTFNRSNITNNFPPKFSNQF